MRLKILLKDFLYFTKRQLENYSLNRLLSENLHHVMISNKSPLYSEPDGCVFLLDGKVIPTSLLLNLSFGNTTWCNHTVYYIMLWHRI